MTHRMVRSVMTASVAMVSLDTPFQGLAAIMADHGVNALPVLHELAYAIDGSRLPTASELDES